MTNSEYYKSNLSSIPPRTVLTLCLGNICRSPIAEGLLRAHIEKAGLNISVDSAGTSAYHVGEAPDPRSIEVMSKHGYHIGQQRSRQLTPKDFQQFDLILAMDQSNKNNALKLIQREHSSGIVALYLGESREVPDPYYGGPNGFDEVYRMIDQAALDWVSLWSESAT